MYPAACLGLALSPGAPALEVPADAALVGEWVVEKRLVGGQRLNALTRSESR